MDVSKDYSGESIGKYSLEERLGCGQFGAVYRACDVVLNNQKAIKIMNVENPTQAYKFFEEAAIPYKCTHTNIVRVNGGSLEIFEDTVHFVIDMELVVGGSLEDLLNEEAISILDTLDIFKAVLFGLQHSHTQGIVHRDIKPANILVDNGIPKLADFGLAAALDSVLPKESDVWYLTHAAPEIWNTKTPTVESDIFAVGVTMFRVINNISNWEKYLQSKRMVRKLIESGTLVDRASFKPYVPSRVVKIIKKACKPNPQDRYHSAAEMRNALERLLPDTNWKRTRELSWGCTDVQVKIAEIINKRNRYEFQIKTNGRKRVSECMMFDTLDEAKRHLHSYIAKTTLK